jgi:hypothetical protein
LAVLASCKNERERETERETERERQRERERRVGTPVRERESRWN